MKNVTKVTLEEPPFWLFYLHDTQKLQLTASETSLHRVTGLPEQCSGGTIKMYEKPRLEERPLAPIHLRPVTLALRAPEGTLSRRHYTYTTTTWCVLHS